jgi:hypothetical protein
MSNFPSLRDSIKATIKEKTKGTTIGMIDIDKNVQLFAAKVVSEKISSIITKVNFTDAELARYQEIMMAMFAKFSSRCVVNSFAFAKLLDAEKLETPVELKKHGACIYFGANLGQYTLQLWHELFFVGGAIHNDWEYTNEENKFHLQSKNKLLFVQVINGKIVIYVALKEIQKNEPKFSLPLQNDKVLALYEYCNAKGVVPAVYYD